MWLLLLKLTVQLISVRAVRRHWDVIPVCFLCGLCWGTPVCTGMWSQRSTGFWMYIFSCWELNSMFQIQVCPARGGFRFHAICGSEKERSSDKQHLTPKSLSTLSASLVLRLDWLDAVIFNRDTEMFRGVTGKEKTLRSCELPTPALGRSSPWTAGKCFLFQVCTKFFFASCTC